METTDYTITDGRGDLQQLRSLVARAVSTSRGNVAKTNWLSSVLGIAIISATAGTDGEQTVFTSDTTSNSYPGLISTLRTALSNSSIFRAEHSTQLISDLNDADAILTA